MADIIKHVDRNIPLNARMQLFSEADAGVGDVILVRESIGRNANQVNITATAAMTVRINVYHQTVGIRNDVENTNVSSWAPGLNNPAKVTTYQSDSNPAIPLEAGEVLELNNDITVKDIEIVAAAGAFEILVM